MYLDIYRTIHRGRFLDSELELAFLKEKAPDYLEKTRTTSHFLIASSLMFIVISNILYYQNLLMEFWIYFVANTACILLLSVGFYLYSLMKKKSFSVETVFVASFILKLLIILFFGFIFVYATPEMLQLYAINANITLFAFYFLFPDSYFHKLLSSLLFSLIYFEISMLVFPLNWVYNLGAFLSLCLLNYVGAITVLRLETTAREAFRLHQKLETEIEEHVRTRFELEYLVMMDPLTRAYNRRFFEKKLKESNYNAERYGHVFSLVMMDLDYFKRINDRYGHSVGDEVLKWFSTQAQKSLRDSDIFARYGGEEFILILPETRLAGALVVAERIQGHLKEYPFYCEEENLKITASIGISVYKPEIKSEQLLSQADEALYQSKAKGRDQISYTPFKI